MGTGRCCERAYADDSFVGLKGTVECGEGGSWSVSAQAKCSEGGDVTHDHVPPDPTPNDDTVWNLRGETEFMFQNS